MDAAAIESRLRDLFAADPRGAAAVYLFGSTARGTHRAASDVDVAILSAGAPPSGLEALDLEGDLERALGRRTQLIVLERAPVDLVHRVLRDGRLLLDRDPSRRIRFEVRSRQEYFDLLPVLRRYRRLPESTA